MEPALAAVFARLGDIPEGLDARKALRLALIDDVDMAPADFDEVAGAALLAVADGRAKQHEVLWLRARTGFDDDEFNRALVEVLLLGDASPTAAYKRLTRLPQGAMRHALDWVGSIEGSAALVVQAVEATGKRVQSWASRSRGLGFGSAHDAITILPLQPSQPTALSRLLTEVEIGGMQPDKARAALEAICADWENLADRVSSALEDGMTPTLSDVATWQKASQSGMFTDGLTAQVWAKNARSWSSFLKAMRLVEQSVTVPRLPVPTRVYRSPGGFTARFLDRSDPLGLVLGDLTDCCQRLGSAGSSCVTHGMTDPTGGFFVVFDKSGRVVGQSWAWFTAKGLCFDNIELLESDYAPEDVREARRDEVRDLYEQAASDLAPLYGRVTVGVAYTDSTLVSSFKAAGDDRLSNRRLKYSDADKQRRLAVKDAPGLKWKGSVLYVGSTATLDVSRSPGPAGRLRTNVRVLADTPQAMVLTDWVIGDDDAAITHADGTLEERTGAPLAYESLMGAQWSAYQQWLNVLDQSDQRVAAVARHEPSLSAMCFLRGIPLDYLVDRIDAARGRNEEFWTSPHVLAYVSRQIVEALSRGLTHEDLLLAEASELSLDAVHFAYANGATVSDVLWARERNLENALYTATRQGLSREQLLAVLEHPLVAGQRLYFQNACIIVGAGRDLDAIEPMLDEFGQRTVTAASEANWPWDLVRVRLSNTTPALQKVNRTFGPLDTGTVRRFATTDELFDVFTWPVHPADAGRLLAAGLSVEQARTLLVDRAVSARTVLSALGAGLSPSSIFELLDAKVSLASASSCVRAGLSVERVKAAHASKVSLQALAQAKRANLSDGQFNRLVKSGAPVGDVIALVSVGMDLSEALSLEGPRELRTLAEAARSKSMLRRQLRLAIKLIGVGIDPRQACAIAQASGIDAIPDPIRPKHVKALNKLADHMGRPDADESFGRYQDRSSVMQVRSLLRVAESLTVTAELVDAAVATGTDLRDLYYALSRTIQQGWPQLYAQAKERKVDYALEGRRMAVKAAKELTESLVSQLASTSPRKVKVHAAAAPSAGGVAPAV